jgi:hypothetical protein
MLGQTAVVSVVDSGKQELHPVGAARYAHLGLPQGRAIVEKGTQHPTTDLAHRCDDLDVSTSF